MKANNTNKNNEIKERVRRLRMMTGLSRKKFSTDTDISQPTLASWEDPPAGRYGITSSGVDRLIYAVCKFNIECSKEWLLLGTGSPPRFTCKNLETKLSDISWGQEESIIKDISSFTTNNKDSCILLMSDSSMTPLFNKGDYVGGIRILTNNYSNLIGKICLIETNKLRIARKVISMHDNKFTLTSINTDPHIKDIILTDIIVDNVYEIIWHRWKSSIILDNKEEC